MVDAIQVMLRRFIQFVMIQVAICYTLLQVGSAVWQPACCIQFIVMVLIRIDQLVLSGSNLGSDSLCMRAEKWALLIWQALGNL